MSFWFSTFTHHYISGGSPTTFHMITKHHPLLELEQQIQLNREKPNRHQEDISLVFYKELTASERIELSEVIENSVDINGGEFYVRDEEEMQQSKENE